MTVFDLGYCGDVPRDTSNPRNRLLFLPDAQLIVAVECIRAEGGWRCGVIAGNRLARRPGHLTLTDDDLAHAHTTLAADPIHDPDLYALVWQARVLQGWLGGHIQAVARVMAESLRPPGTLTIDIDQCAATRLITAARIRVPGLRRILARLTDGGMLRLDLPNVDGWGSYTLTIPIGYLGRSAPQESAHIRETPKGRSRL